MEFAYYYDEEEFEYEVSDERVYLEAAKILTTRKLDTNDQELAITLIRRMAFYIDEPEQFFADIGVADEFEREAIEWYREGVK